MGFVLGFTSDLSAEAVGLALYVMLVTLEMFRAAVPRKLRKVKDAAIMRLWRESQTAVRESLEAEAGTDPLVVLLAGSADKLWH